ncbi:MAG: Holliday junction branch migration DNA helicase RuvB [Patescibacteria group bacterium]
MTTQDLTQLRPTSLKSYVGQEQATKPLEIFLEAVKSRGYASEHILFYGPPGIGKTTLSHIIAHELKGTMRVSSGAAIQKTGDLAAILTNLKDNDVFFIDEIHRMPRVVEEMLYPVLEEYYLDVIIGKGPSARTVRLPIPKVTIIGATTKLAMLSGPLRDRFGLLLRLDYYSESHMESIVKRSAEMLEISITTDAAREIARRARRTPRIANRIIKRARDILEVDGHSEINAEVINKLFNLLDIDAAGLTEIDIQYLEVIGKRFQNSPIGIETLASSLAEDRRTIEEYIEPYLLQIGFVKKTNRGRVLTPKALEHINKTGQPQLDL